MQNNSYDNLYIDQVSPIRKHTRLRLIKMPSSYHLNYYDIKAFGISSKLVHVVRVSN